MKGMRYAVAAMALHVCGAFQQPRTTRSSVALRAKPKVVVFDLDGCLWDPEMYMLSWRGGAPFEPDGDAMLSQSGERVVLLGAAREILRELRTTDDWSATKVAISSRTDEPAWAAELLDKFRVDEMVLRQCTVHDLHAIDAKPARRREYHWLIRTGARLLLRRSGDHKGVEELALPAPQGEI